MVPTSTNRAAWATETPSRSTVDRPIAAASSSRSTRWSCSRLTSSTYSIPRCAAGEQPGLVLGHPAGSQRLLQVQRADHPVLGRPDRQLDQPSRPRCASPHRVTCGPSGQLGSGSPPDRRRTGSPRRPSTAGSRPASARTMVDLAVPFSPRTSTPPISGETAASDEGQGHVVGADDGREGIVVHEMSSWRVSAPARVRWEGPVARILAAADVLAPERSTRLTGASRSAHSGGTAPDARWIPPPLPVPIIPQPGAGYARPVSERRVGAIRSSVVATRKANRLELSLREASGPSAPWPRTIGLEAPGASEREKG